jgi:hypothetical protein
MAYSATIPYTGGLAGYVKPVTPGSLPSSSPSWGDDVISQASATSGVGFTVTGLADGQTYWAYARTGLSPASTDERLGTITPADELIATAATQATAAATEIGKVPRAAVALIAGGDFAWNAQSDTTNKLTLNITTEA